MTAITAGQRHLSTRLDLEIAVADEVKAICKAAGADDRAIACFLTDVVVESLLRRADEWRLKEVDPSRASVEEIVGVFRPSLIRVLETAAGIAHAEQRSVMLIDILSAISAHRCAIWPLCRPVPIR